MESDSAILSEIGARIARHRLNQDMTQAALAESAGVSRPTVARLETGSSITLTSLIRVLRVLNLSANFEQFIPMPAQSPVMQLQSQQRERKRASGKTIETSSEQPWSWDDTP